MDYGLQFAQSQQLDTTLQAEQAKASLLTILPGA
jgi:hypothetical protein